MIRIIFAIITTTLLLTPYAVIANDDALLNIDNKQYLSLEEFNQYISHIESQKGYKLSKEQKIKLLEQISSQYLLYAYAIKSGFNHDPKIQNEIEAIKRRLLAEQQLENFIKANVTVTEKEAQEYFDNNKHIYLRPDLFNGVFYKVSPKDTYDEKTVSIIIERIKELAVKNNYQPLKDEEIIMINDVYPDYTITKVVADNYYKGRKIPLPTNVADRLTSLKPKTFTVMKSEKDTVLISLINRIKGDNMTFEALKNRIINDLYELKAKKAHIDYLQQLKKEFNLKVHEELVK